MMVVIKTKGKKLKTYLLIKARTYSNWKDVLSSSIINSIVGKEKQKPGDVQDQTAGLSRSSALTAIMFA